MIAQTKSKYHNWKSSLILPMICDSVFSYSSIGHYKKKAFQRQSCFVPNSNKFVTHLYGWRKIFVYKFVSNTAWQISISNNIYICLPKILLGTKLFCLLYFVSKDTGTKLFCLLYYVSQRYRDEIILCPPKIRATKLFCLQYYVSKDIETKLCCVPQRYGQRNYFAS